MADLLLMKFKSFEGAIAAPLLRLAEIPELDPEAADALKVIHLAGIRFHRNFLRQVSVVENWDVLFCYLRIQLAFEDREQIKLLFLDETHRLLVEEVHSVGGFKSVTFYPTDIVRRALKAMAPFLIVAHNHPSGNAQPTRQDKIATIALQREAAAAGVKLLDQLIVGGHGLTSFRQKGWLD